MLCPWKQHNCSPPRHPGKCQLSPPLPCPGSHPSYSFYLGKENTQYTRNFQELSHFLKGIKIMGPWSRLKLRDKHLAILLHWNNFYMHQPQHQKHLPKTQQHTDFIFLGKKAKTSLTLWEQFDILLKYDPLTLSNKKKTPLLYLFHRVSSD